MWLTKLLPTMMSIWLNYINDFGYSLNVKKKTCFCMSKSSIDIEVIGTGFIFLLWKNFKHLKHKQKHKQKHFK